MDAYKIAEKVRAERIKQKMKQIELAKKTGLSNTYISDIERGRTLPSLKSLEKISNVLGVKCSAFIEDG